MGELVKLEQLHWGEKLSAMLNNMRSSQTLCDTAIVCRDNSTLRCHKCVVAASSTAMSKVLIDLEGKKELTPGKEILVRTNIEKDIWEAVLQFMYTGIAIIKPERMTYLRRVAEKFCISELHDLCTEFERQENCRVASEKASGKGLERIAPKPPASDDLENQEQMTTGQHGQSGAVRPTSMGMPIPQQYPAPPLTLTTPVFQGVDVGQMQNMMTIPGPALPNGVLNSVNTGTVAGNMVQSNECLTELNGTCLPATVADTGMAVTSADNLALDFSGLESIPSSDGMFTSLSQTTNYSSCGQSVSGGVVYSSSEVSAVNPSFYSLTSQAISDILTSSAVTSVTELLNTPSLIEKTSTGTGIEKHIDLTNCEIVPEQDEQGIIGEPSVIAPVGFFQSGMSKQEVQSSKKPSLPVTLEKLPVSTITTTAVSVSEKNLLNSGLPDVVPSDQLNSTPCVNQKLDKNTGFLTSLVDSLKDDNNYINSEPTVDGTPSEDGSSSAKPDDVPTKKPITTGQSNLWKDKKQCRHCGQKFTSLRKLLHHGRTDHPGEKMRVYYCEECDQDFFNSQQLQMHLSYHNSVDSSENFICEHCGNTFGEVRRLEAHIDNVHREKNLTCKLCGALFTRTVQLEDHLEKYCTGKYTIIPNNQTGTATAESLSSENQDSDSQSLPDYSGCSFAPLMTYICDTCKQAFSTLEHLAAHAQVHIATGRLTPFSDVSSSLFSQVSDALHINESETTCSIQDNIDDFEMVPNCKLLSPTKLIGGNNSPETDMANFFNLKANGPFGIKGRHKKTCKNKWYHCRLCKEQFSSVLEKAGHLLRHRCYHRCNICGRRFDKLYLLKKHKLWYHCEFTHLPHSFRCKYCQASFSSESMLQFHTNTKHFPIVESPNTTIMKDLFGDTQSNSSAWTEGSPLSQAGDTGETKSDPTPDQRVTQLNGSMNLLENLSDNSMSGENVLMNLPRPINDVPMGGAHNIANTLPESDDIHMIHEDPTMVGSNNMLPSIDDSDNIELPMNTSDSLISTMDGSSDIDTGAELIVESMGMSGTTDYGAVVSSDDPFIPPPAAYNS